MKKNKKEIIEEIAKYEEQLQNLRQENKDLQRSLTCTKTQLQRSEDEARSSAEAREVAEAKDKEIAQLSRVKEEEIQGLKRRNEELAGQLELQAKGSEEFQNVIDQL